MSSRALRDACEIACEPLRRCASSQYRTWWVRKSIAKQVQALPEFVGNECNQPPSDKLHPLGYPGRLVLNSFRRVQRMQPASPWLVASVGLPWEAAASLFVSCPFPCPPFPALPALLFPSTCPSLPLFSFAPCRYLSLRPVDHCELMSLLVSENYVRGVRVCRKCLNR